MHHESRRSPDASPNSPSMSNTHASSTPCWAIASARPRVSASDRASGSMPTERWLSAVTVASA